MRHTTFSPWSESTGRGQLREQTYDPRRQQGVSIYREQVKAFFMGDRIQFTAPANELEVANRELGSIQSVTDHGRIGLRMDSGRIVSIDPKPIRTWTTGMW